MKTKFNFLVLMIILYLFSMILSIESSQKQKKENKKGMKSSNNNENNMTILSDSTTATKVIPKTTVESLSGITDHSSGSSQRSSSSMISEGLPGSSIPLTSSSKKDVTMKTGEDATPQDACKMKETTIFIEGEEYSSSAELLAGLDQDRSSEDGDCSMTGKPFKRTLFRGKVTARPILGDYDDPNYEESSNSDSNNTGGVSEEMRSDEELERLNNLKKEDETELQKSTEGQGDLIESQRQETEPQEQETELKDQHQKSIEGQGDLIESQRQETEPQEQETEPQEQETELKDQHQKSIEGQGDLIESQRQETEPQEQETEPQEQETELKDQHQKSIESQGDLRKSQRQETEPQEQELKLKKQNLESQEQETELKEQHQKETPGKSGTELQKPIIKEAGYEVITSEEIAEIDRFLYGD